MQNPTLSHQVRHQHRQLVYAMLVLVLLGVLGEWLLGRFVAISVILGCLLHYIAHALVLYFSQKPTPKHRRHHGFLMNIYVAHATKWVVVMTGFVLIFQLQSIRPAYVIMAYIAMQLMFMIGLFKNHTKK